MTVICLDLCICFDAAFTDSSCSFKENSFHVPPYSNHTK